MNSSPTASVERRFYIIVRWFGLILTTIALALAAVAAVIALSKSISFSQSTSAIHTPTTVTYGEYMRTLETRRSDSKPAEDDTTLERKEQAAAAATADAEFEKRLKPHLDAIVATLVNYAVKVDQPKPSAQAIGDYLRSNMQRIGRSNRDSLLSWDFVDGLQKAAHDLADDADRLSHLGADDPRRIRWDIFLGWYTEQYDRDLLAQIQESNSERLRAASQAAEAPVYFYTGAAAFGVFIAGTLLLLLLRIEMNTRPPARHAGAQMDPVQDATTRQNA